MMLHIEGHFFLDIYQYMSLSCILQNGHKKLDDGYINGTLQLIMLIGAAKCSN